MSFKGIIVSGVVSGCALALSACATTGPRSDYDARNDFSAYETYSWAVANPVQASGAHPVSGLTKQRIQDGAQTALAAKGFQFVEDAADADFTISFTVGTRDELRTTHEPGSYIIDGWGRAYYIPGNSTPYQYTEGSLAVDIFDTQSRRPVWHGVGEKKLSNSELRSQRDDADVAVAEILAPFPPQP